MTQYTQEQIVELYVKRVLNKLLKQDILPAFICDHRSWTCRLELPQDNIILRAHYENEPRKLRGFTLNEFRPILKYFTVSRYYGI